VGVARHLRSADGGTRCDDRQRHLRVRETDSDPRELGVGEEHCGRRAHYGEMLARLRDDHARRSFFYYLPGGFEQVLTADLTVDATVARITTDAGVSEPPPEPVERDWNTS
jgi:hypothetical protein